MQPDRHNLFDRDIKLAKKRGLDLERLKVIIRKLCNREKLPPRCHDHLLKGNWIDFRECHILPDWLLIYRVNEAKQTLELARTGTHSDIFKR